jgi:hypothetical protein
VEWQRVPFQRFDLDHLDLAECREDPVGALPGRVYKGEQLRQGNWRRRWRYGCPVRKWGGIAFFRPEARPATLTGAQARGAVAIGALAVGAAAVGGFAIGRLSVGRLAIGRAAIGRLVVEDLEVGRLRVREEQRPS